MNSNSRVLTVWTLLAWCATMGAVHGEGVEQAVGDESDSMLARRPSYAMGWMAYSDRLDALETELASYRGNEPSYESSPSYDAEHVQDCACTACAIACDGVCPGFFISVDYLKWKPRRRGLDFAIADGDGDEDVEGRLESLELDSKSGLRTKIGYLTESSWDVGVTYTYYHSRDSRFLQDSAGGTLWINRAHPASIDSNEADTASANANLDFDVFDLEAGRWFYPSDCASLRFFGGIRFALVDQNFAVDYQGGNTLFNGHQIGQSVRMEGYGLRGGGEAHWYVRNNFSLFGRASASVLLGDFSTSYTEVNSQDVVVIEEYFQTVPVVEVAVGLNWQRGAMTLQAGYELATWFNMAERMNFAGDGGFANQSVFSNVSNDLGLDGFFVRGIFTL